MSEQRIAIIVRSANQHELKELIQAARKMLRRRVKRAEDSRKCRSK